MQTKTLEKHTQEEEGIDFNNQEDSDGITDETGQEGNANELEQGGEKNIDESGEAGETGEGSGSNEEGAQEVDPRDQKIAELEERLSKIDENISSRQEDQSRQDEAKPLTEEQWAERETRFGVPRAGQEMFASMVAGAVNQLARQMDARFAGFEKEKVLQTMSRTPEFKNIMAFQEGIDEYLKDFSPSMHSNQKILAKAYYYAKGRGSDKQVRSVMNDKELTKKVITRTKTAPPAKRSLNSSGLTKEEQYAWNTIGKHRYKDINEFKAAQNKYKRK